MVTIVKYIEMPDRDGTSSRPGARRILVIHNPAAGRRRWDRLQAVLDELSVLGVSATVRSTTGPGDAERLVGAVSAGDFDVVAIAGGDGTFNEALNGVSGSTPALGVIPLGTANVLAADIGLDPAPRPVAAALALGEIRPVRVGLANGRRFAMMAGIGFDAHVVAGVDLGLKRRIGKGAYGVAAAVQFARFAWPPYLVSADGRDHPAASVVIAKGRHYGGNFVIAPAARIEDASFQVCLFLRKGRFALPRYAAALFGGRLAERPDVKLLTAARVTVTGPAGDPVQLDGDADLGLPLAVGIAPEPVRLVYPAITSSPRARLP